MPSGLRRANVCPPPRPREVANWYQAVWVSTLKTAPWPWPRPLCLQGLLTLGNPWNKTSMSISIYLADVVRLTGHTPHPPAEEPSSAWISPANCDFQPAAATWKLSPHLTGQCHDWRALRNLGRGSGSPQWTSHLASGMLAKKAAKSSRYSDALSPSHPRTICASVLLDCQGWGRFPCPGALQVLKLEMRNGCIIDFVFLPQVLDFIVAFFPGTICLVFAAVGN